MCGIVGILDTFSPPQQSEIVSMRDLMSYRGPDASGVMILNQYGLGLGHRRLSILDTSPTGKQPMSDSKGKYHIVFNGEIFNFIEIRKELQSKGYEFVTQTDTEVILNAYDCWGEDCLHQFVGMFAFALWDEKNNKLFMARDRLGIKPFYYYFDGKRLVFASEVKSVLPGLKNKPSVNTHLIDAYMSFGYVPGEETLQHGIKRLLPGHCMVAQSGTLTIRKYWDLEFLNDHDHGLDHYLERFGALLEDSIKLRLRSDVPLGVFLSGGLDSSAVVSMVAPQLSRRLKTFSVAYDFGEKYNETPYAREVAAQYNTEHYELIITPKDFMDFVPRYINYMDEPVTEAAAISLYYISKFARDHVTVTLSGEGADELFAGYDFYKYNLFMERHHCKFKRLPVFFSEGWSPQHAKLRKINKYMRLARKPLEERYRGISSYEENMKTWLYNKEFSSSLNNQQNNPLQGFLADLFAKTAHNDPLSRMLYFDTKTWLVDDLLIKADRMSMASSVELRVPFLDHRLVEFAASIPSTYKIHKQTSKYILKKLMAEKLPPRIIHRKKMGFPTPLETMFRQDLFDYAADILLSQAARERGYFRHEAVQDMLNSHHSGKSDYHREIWQLLVLEEWHRKNA